MSAELEIPPRMSFEEYLRFEEQSDEKHEFVDGQVVAMPGASDDHEPVSMNLAAAFLPNLRGKGCRVYKSDMKLCVRFNDLEIAYYPDVMAVCDETDDHRTQRTKPKLVVEAMGNYNKDHFEKLFVYQQIPSLEEYLVVDQDPKNPRAWVYRRKSEWKQETFTGGDTISLESIGLSSVLSDLYLA